MSRSLYLFFLFFLNHGLGNGVHAAGLEMRTMEGRALRVTRRTRARVTYGKRTTVLDYSRLGLAIRFASNASKHTYQGLHTTECTKEGIPKKGLRYLFVY
ncbi:hypothetical protein F4810DRAFT_290571 [Camillea tinctor]|nr:hypothetical protein F4810DRAFT_290571 [Camillea tinctor]